MLLLLLLLLRVLNPACKGKVGGGGGRVLGRQRCRAWEV